MSEINMTFNHPYGSRDFIGELYLERFNKIPSFLELSIEVTKTFHQKLATNECEIYFRTFVERGLTNPDDRYSFYVFDHLIISERSDELIFAFSDVETVKPMVKLAKKHQVRHTKLKYEPTFGLVTYEDGYFNTRYVPLKFTEMTSEEIQLHYGDEFHAKYDELEELLLNSQKGLFLLHGIPGSGKSTLIKHLITRISQERKLIYFPPECSEMLGSPSFIPYLMGNIGSIILMEDAENILQVGEAAERKSATTNLLNLTDGIMADVLNVPVIGTFNCDKNSIDPALLRSGRRLFDHNFGTLSVSSANRFLESKNSNVRVEKEHTLAELFGLLA